MICTKNTALSVGLMTALLTLAGCASQPSNTTKTPQRVNISVKNGVPSHYQVQAGDTVAKIAKRYNLNWREVSAINRLDNNHTIYIGQWLVLWQNHSVGKVDFGKSTVLQINPKRELPAPAPTLKSTVKQSVGQVHTQRINVPTSKVAVAQKPATTPTPILTPKPQSDKPTPAIVAKPTPQNAQVSPPKPATNLASLPIVAPTPKPERQDEKAQAPQPPESQAKTTQSGLPLLTPMGNTPLVVRDIGQFRYPVGTQNKVVRQFGASINGAKSEGMFFSGHDGDVVVASQSGIVIYADDNNKTGSPKAVMIEHSNGYVSSYIHLKDIAVKKGQSVAMGASVGSMQAQAANLALFEFRMAKDGHYIDPVSVLK